MSVELTKENQCQKCGGFYEWSRYCGAKVCLECDDHKGLERCYCGWSKTRPGQGYQELIDMGETIEPEGAPDMPLFLKRLKHSKKPDY